MRARERRSLFPASSEATSADWLNSGVSLSIVAPFEGVHTRLLSSPAHIPIGESVSFGRVWLREPCTPKYPARASRSSREELFWVCLLTKNISGSPGEFDTHPVSAMTSKIWANANGRFLFRFVYHKEWQWWIVECVWLFSNWCRLWLISI